MAAIVTSEQIQAKESRRTTADTIHAVGVGPPLCLLGGRGLGLELDDDIVALHRVADLHEHSETGKLVNTAKTSVSLVPRGARGKYKNNSRLG